MSDPFSNPTISKRMMPAVMTVAAVVLAASPALAMFSGEIVPQESLPSSSLPIFSTFIIALIVAVIFFVVSHILSRR